MAGASIRQPSRPPEGARRGGPKTRGFPKRSLCCRQQTAILAPVLNPAQHTDRRCRQHFTCSPLLTSVAGHPAYCTPPPPPPAAAFLLLHSTLESRIY